ncbi:MAG: hypothetical protein AB1480_17140 [Nitrospirota bacterium]
MKLDQIGFWSEIKLEIIKNTPKNRKRGQVYYPAGREPIEIKIIEGDE